MVHDAPVSSFYVHGTCSGVPSFTHDISNLCPLFIPIGPAKGLSILSIFSKNLLLVSFIFSIDFPFSVSSIYAQFFLSFRLLWAGPALFLDSRGGSLGERPETFSSAGPFALRVPPTELRGRCAPHTAESLSFSLGSECCKVFL